MRSRKIQAKVEPELELHVMKQPEFRGMSDYVRDALIRKSKFKADSQRVRIQSKYTPKSKV